MSHEPGVSSFFAAITGVGLLTPLGDTLEGLHGRLGEGQHAIPKAADLPIKLGACIEDLDVSRYATVRGMRVYNRTTQLAICAAKRALDDAKLDTSLAAGERVGLIMASTFGHLDTLITYDRSLVSNGVARTNPALMPLAHGGAPGAATALAFNAKAFSVTLSNGSTSSLDALGLAGRLLADGRADACVVVSAFSPFQEFWLSADRAGFLAREELRVFDKRRQGTVLGEAAVALVLERPESLRARGGSALGFMRGQASAFAADEGQRAGRLCRASREALSLSGVAPHELSLVSSGASGSIKGDLIEGQALTALFAGGPSNTPIIAVKANLGDALDASGLLQTAVALEALRVGTAPKIAGLEAPETEGLRYLTQSTSIETRHALITAAWQAGPCSAVVVSTLS